MENIRTKKAPETQAAAMTSSSTHLLEPAGDGESGPCMQHISPWDIQPKLCALEPRCDGELLLPTDKVPGVEHKEEAVAEG